MAEACVGFDEPTHCHPASHAASRRSLLADVQAPCYQGFGHVHHAPAAVLQRMHPGLSAPAQSHIPLLTCCACLEELMSYT